ncbi:segregation/condensation protein A [Streptomyces sp. NPDC056534]|uniref:segregation/condensation protein A n=1 Tax=Streptomyces sp. NPDC056534 TaxID=3345857 RepID=UPI0036AD26A9
MPGVDLAIEVAPSDEPETVPAPSVEPETVPAPSAVPEPEPELVPEVEPAFEPMPAPGPVPASGAELPPESEVEPETVPVPEVELATVPEVEVEPATEHDAAPSPAPSPVPVPESAPSPAPEVEPAPAAESSPVPSPEPAPPPTGDPATGPGGGDGRFTVRLANFEGPFDLLLQLITKHKLDVTEVALSRVTDEFMAHLRALGPDGDLDQTTEFLVVAATLLDLKAARLLPAAEVEDEADLALLEARDLLFARLLQYRAYKRIAAIFEERWEAEGRRHPRTVGLEPHHAELLPEVVISIGAEGFARLAVKAMQPKAEPQVYVDHIHAPLVSVRKQAAVVVSLLRERGTALFRELIEDVGDDTLTVVARFLALLELYREKAVALDQETALGDLTVSWTGGEADPAAAVTDEFDQETTA